ncbi:cardiolipin synthase ClsB [Azoarcus olearius]|uniref:Cardiolipin synthase B n=1 Tax=Azoarcus sp. (strain BH72) TaxID=418699 RepID=A1K3F5_AZOSB|nr:cardiolipin synthase ClsB [Azoarcus olearius]ANQ83887.1 putative cardiolipin synthetase [Azoarcus olearius]CAL93360.1 putative cardiolipin synthetase [Azoarcus olearius]
MTVLVEGNAIALLENGLQYFPALEAEIDSARHEIFLETYIFSRDVVGRRIAAALVRAAARGVRVRVLVDGFGGREFVRDLMPGLLADGVEVLIFRRELRLTSLRRHRLRRMHRKIALIDARVAFVGGINITDDFELSGPPHPRYDYAVRVEGPLLAEIAEAVHRLWRLVSWASLQRRLQEAMRLPRRGPPAGGLRAAFLVRDNLRHRRDIEDAYLAAIGRAREEIVIANAYFFPGRQFRQALLEAAARGVRVTLVLQGLADHPVLAHATRALYPHFLQRGIRLFEYHRSYLHAKVAVVDRRWATVGSSNIDPFSLWLAREANVVVEDAGFAGSLHRSLESAVQEGARELHREDWRRQRTLRRVASWLAYQAVRLAIGIAGYGGRH